jgi:hypothetical protein
MAFGGTLEGGGDWNATSAQTAVNAVRTFWDAFKTYLPNEVVLTVSPVVDVYSTSLGALVGSYTAATAPAQVTGGDTGIYSMASGVKVQWNTGVILNGRRVRGSTFIVPAGGTAFTVSGLVGATPRSSINTAGANLISAMATATHPFGVWSRPKTTTSDDGVFSAITAPETVEKGAILRGRRD